MSIPWYVAVFESFPEAFLILIVGFSLFNMKIGTKNAIVISILSALSTYFVRQAPITFGIHSIIAVLILIILSVFITRKNIWPVMLAILGGVVILAILQSLTIPIMFELASVEFSDISDRPWLNVVFFIPQAVVMLGISLFTWKTNWYLYDLGQKDKEIA